MTRYLLLFDSYGLIFVGRGSVQSGRWLPSLWAERPAAWFAKAEAQFTLDNISSEKTKFCHVISQLDHRYAAEVEDIIISPPE
jgi:hypothetical protein